MVRAFPTGLFIARPFSDGMLLASHILLQSAFRSFSWRALNLLEVPGNALPRLRRVDGAPPTRPADKSVRPRVPQHYGYSRPQKAREERGRGRERGPTVPATLLERNRFPDLEP